MFDIFHKVPGVCWPFLRDLHKSLRVFQSYSRVTHESMFIDTRETLGISVTWPLAMTDINSYSLSNVTMVDRKFTSFPWYWTSCYKRGTRMFGRTSTNNGQIFTSLAWFLSKLVYLSMLFILELPCCSRINNILKCANFVETGASEVTLGSYDGALSTEHIAKMFVTIFQILKEWRNFYPSNIWQPLPCLFVHTRTACEHEQSAFKSIVTDGSVLSNFTNPLLLDTKETCGCYSAWNSLCYFIFCITSMPQNAKTTWNTQNRGPSFCWERGVCINSGMRVWTNEYG